METPDLVNRLEELLAELERLPEPALSNVFEFLEGLEAIHRAAVEALGQEIDESELARVAAARPEVSWLFSAYGLAVDQRPEAEAALAAVARDIAAQGAALEVVEAREGAVRVRLGGGVAADARPLLERSVEDALRRHMPAFRQVEFESGGGGHGTGSSGIQLPIHHVGPKPDGG